MTSRSDQNVVLVDQNDLLDDQNDVLVDQNVTESFFRVVFFCCWCIADEVVWGSQNVNEKSMKNL